MDNLKLFTFQFPIITLTDIECTDTTHTIVGVTTTDWISTLFLRCTPATTVYTSLIRIHDGIVARRNYKREARILNIWSDNTHLDKYLIDRHH